jgi:hypothetical protein
MPSVMIKETEVFTFDELSDSAKEKARDWYREGNLSFDWWESVYEMADTAGKLLGIDIDRKGRNSSQPAIWFSGFYHQGSFCYIEADYKHAKGAVKAIKQEFPQDSDLHSIAERLQAEQKPCFYKLGARMESQYRNGQSVEVFHTEELYKDIGKQEEELRDILRDFSSWIYSALEKEYEYLNSDSFIDEGIAANEYQFTEDGEIYF